MLFYHGIFNSMFICNFFNFVLMANVINVFSTFLSVQLNAFSFFTLLSSISRRFSRASLCNKITITMLYRHSDSLFFLSVAVKSWNNLPNNLISINNINILK